jgi:hypothetical protein
MADETAPTGGLITLVILAEPEQAGRPVEFLRLGTFTDAGGRQVEITEEVLDGLVASFSAGAAGQDVPIDILHERREAAGWVRRIYRQGKKLLADVEWNALGQQLVGDRVYRYLSATIDLAGQVLRSISLVNFPAVKGLRPVELAEALFAGEAEPEPTETPAEPEPPAPAIETETPAPTVALEQPGDVSAHEAGQQPVEEINMSDKEQVVSTPAQNPPAEPNTANEAVLTQMREQVLAEFKSQMEGEYRRLEQERGRLFAEMMEQVRTERELTQFAETVTATGRHALPVKADDLTALLKDTPKGLRERWQAVLGTLHTAGPVDFTEHGTAAGGAPKQLDPEMAKALARFIKSGGKADIFFEANDLGSPTAYDLSEWGG